MYNEGINYVGDVLDLASNEGVVEKAGAWYSYKGQKIGQGRPAAISYFKENPKELDEISNKVRELDIAKI